MDDPQYVLDKKTNVFEDKMIDTPPTILNELNC